MLPGRLSFSLFLLWILSGFIPMSATIMDVLSTLLFLSLFLFLFLLLL